MEKQLFCWLAPFEIHQFCRIDGEIKEDLISTKETLQFDVVSNEIIFASYFECGKCFIGELVIVPLIMRNIGEDGKFFIISEVDWSSMKIEDVTINNMVLTPPFAISPAYFILQHNEEIKFQSLFFPSTYGVQVDKYFIIGDNCSVQPIEIIGDGITFEEKFILLNEQNLVTELSEDRDAKYCIELKLEKCEKKFETLIEIRNTSDVILHYRWEHRQVSDENNGEKNWENLLLENISINPKTGIFQPNSSSLFVISVEIENLMTLDEFRTILQLCIEDIPLAAINKNLNLNIQDSAIKRRMCKIVRVKFYFTFSSIFS
ncbi:deleted in lung and esophageal cancer protein 1-like [Leptopilina heterotoma]|uniref:deleted in lung and esophageal cancer protein 1-like n=1 Tax=Leptopilina heterotoma TaxID=63436 RepID=UPI001CA979DA|nr:deleted in lung and esophageal cancer protein 1-like [Leptopilina heterotoma]